MRVCIMGSVCMRACRGYVCARVRGCIHVRVCARGQPYAEAQDACPFGRQPPHREAAGQAAGAVAGTFASAPPAAVSLGAWLTACEGSGQGRRVRRRWPSGAAWTLEPSGAGHSPGGQAGPLIPCCPTRGLQRVWTGVDGWGLGTGQAQPLAASGGSNPVPLSPPSPPGVWSSPLRSNDTFNPPSGFSSPWAW